MATTIIPGAGPNLSALRADIAALVPHSLVLFAQQRTLNPLYGSYLTLFSLNAVVSAATLISVLKPFGVKKDRSWLVAGLLLSIAPNASYWIAVLGGRQKWLTLGPVLAHIAAVAPLTLIFTELVVQSVSTSAEPPIQSRLLGAGISYLVTRFLAQKVWPRVSYLKSVSDSEIYLALAGAAFAVWIINTSFSSDPAKSKKKTKTSRSSLSPAQIKATIVITFSAFWYTISPQLSNPVLPHPLQETFTHPSGRLQIHSAVQSVTGLVVVGETLPPLDGEDDPMHSARYLRVDHSLLGGVWMRDKAMPLDDSSEPLLVDSYGTKLGDTVYSTFVLQEAARLVNSTEAGKTGKTGHWQNALAIGLGTGLSATSFMRHGLNTTIVEIDPAVYDAARTWFGLPDPGPGNVFLQDARGWVEQRSREIQAGDEERLYDIVVHDCFSGGGVPEHIFTMEFWESLKLITKADGIVVVNFAGVVTSPSSKMILHTLEQSFKQCRGFNDWMDPLEEDQYDTEFINIVYFCTNSDAPLTFRKPKRSDYLGSHLRKFMFQGLETREVNLDIIRAHEPEEAKKYILTDKHNPLGGLQKKQGLHHWEVMRVVLPDVHWETY